MSDKLRSMQVFVSAAGAGSFAAAGEELGMSAVMVGKHVRALEERLGATLIERSTRKQALTEIGLAYLERCREVLSGVEAADRVAETLRAEPQGSLRISAPVAYGSQRLAPVIAAYSDIYPRVRVELILNNQLTDMAEEGIDVAFRSGAVVDADLIARPLRPTHMLTAASPAYLKRHGTPGRPSDLLKHNLLAFSAWGADHHLRYMRGGTTVAVPVRGTLVSNSGTALAAAAVAGMGVVVQPDGLLEPAIAAGQLTLLLPKWELPTRALHLVRRPEARPSAKVRSFVDFVLERLGEKTE